MSKISVKQALKNGIEAHRAGNIKEADRFYTAILKAHPNHPDANHNLGVLAASIGQNDKAIELFENAIAANPKIDQFWLNLIDAIIKSKNIEYAISTVLRAKAVGILNPKLDKLHNDLSEKNVDNFQEYSPKNVHLREKAKSLISHNKVAEIIALLEPEIANNQDVELMHILAIAYYRNNQFKKACDIFGNVFRIAPNHEELLIDYGVILKSGGYLEKAEHIYTKALKINKDNPITLSNLANLQSELGKTQQANDNYRSAIRLDNNNANIYMNYGRFLYTIGQNLQALHAFANALKIDPEIFGGLSSFAIALCGANFIHARANFDHLIIKILQGSHVMRPRSMGTAIISNIKIRPSIAKLLQPNHCSLEHKINTVSECEVLLAFMRNSTLADYELESFFTQLREDILNSHINQTTSFLGALKVVESIALHCFTNEYVYSETAGETELLNALQSRITSQLKCNSEPANLSDILIFAMYRDINTVSELNIHHLHGVSEEFKKRIFLDRQQENFLKGNILSLTEITDKTSSQVRQQYEENPYPRWTQCTLAPVPVTLDKHFDNRNITTQRIGSAELDNPRILIAGCGTGQDPIETARLFSNSKVTAIDLSKSSLAYAMRMSHETSTLNLEFHHADILELDVRSAPFDVIQSMGVLHHMLDPLAGWQVLVDHLKPGGMMRLGFYSRAARADVNTVRQYISQQNIGSSIMEIRKFRKLLMEDGLKFNFNSPVSDLYSTSEMRDLFFHVQEHQYSIPELSQMMNKLGLQFCGFESLDIQKRFVQTFDQGELYNLNLWEKFEDMYPNTFIGMYQFWCQKLT